MPNITDGRPQLFTCANITRGEGDNAVLCVILIITGGKAPLIIVALKMQPCNHFIYIASVTRSSKLESRMALTVTRRTLAHNGRHRARPSFGAYS